MRKVLMIVSVVAVFLVGTTEFALSQAVSPVPGGVRLPPGAVAVPGGGGNQPPGGGGGGANVPDNYNVQVSSPTGSNSGGVQKSAHNPQGDAAVEAGWRQNQREHGKQ